jgi:hypothetical protein
MPAAPTAAAEALEEIGARVCKVCLSDLILLGGEPRCGTCGWLEKDALPVADARAPVTSEIEQLRKKLFDAERRALAAERRIADHDEDALALAAERTDALKTAAGAVRSTTHEDRPRTAAGEAESPRSGRRR